MLLGCCLHPYNSFYLMLTLRSRQADIVVTVSSLESDNSDRLLLSHTLRVSRMKKGCITVPQALIFKPVKKQILRQTTNVSSETRKIGRNILENKCFGSGPGLDSDYNGLADPDPRRPKNFLKRKFFRNFPF
jgi:hypothetical protein